MTVSHHQKDVLWEQRHDDMSWRQIDEEVIVLDLRSATYLRVNPIGALLWRQLESAVTETTLIQLLVERFDLTIDQAQGDVAAFLESCLAKELIEPHRF
jgi:hypothetical protein